MINPLVLITAIVLFEGFKAASVLGFEQADFQQVVYFAEAHRVDTLSEPTNFRYHPNTPTSAASPYYTNSTKQRRRATVGGQQLVRRSVGEQINALLVVIVEIGSAVPLMLNVTHD